MTKPGWSVPAACLDLGKFKKDARRRMFVKPLCELGIAEAVAIEGTVKKEPPKEFISPFFACGATAEWATATLDIIYWEFEGFQVPIITNEKQLKKDTILEYYRPARASRRYDFGDSEPVVKKART